MPEFQRPKDGFRFRFEGMNTKAQPDALPVGKYSLAQNVRSYSDDSIRTRPGYSFLFFCGTPEIDLEPLTDLRTYTAVGTDSLPRILARSSTGKIWLDNSVRIATLTGTGPGASMIPYRPNESIQPWMYIADGSDYQKLSAPDGSNSVVARKVGIAEPQTPPESCPNVISLLEVTGVAANWAQGGTAGAITDGTRTTDTVVALFDDPAAGTFVTKIIQVGSVAYSVGQTLKFHLSTGADILNIYVQDVLPPFNSSTSITIQSIYYFTGTTGRCVIVPTQLPSSGTIPTFDGNTPAAASFNRDSAVTSLRRGSLVQFPGGEVALVLSVTIGPDGNVCFETTTVGSYSSGQVIQGVPAIVCSFPFGFPSGQLVGQPVTSAELDYAGTIGIATIERDISAVNPFVLALQPVGIQAQTDDYIHISLKLDDPSQLIEGKVLFDVNNGTPDFKTNAYYYAFRPNDLQLAIQNAQTQLSAAQIVAQRVAIDAVVADVLEDATGVTSDTGAQIETGAGQWTEIRFPLSALTRIGNDETRSLTNCSRVQVLLNLAGAVNASVGSVWVGGGGKADVGDDGMPYLYRVRPRDSRTGAVGNPSPATRYGISPRRQSANVVLPSASYDAQIDTWDVYRFGGSIFSWRYVGSAASSSTSFTDNFFDSSLTGTSELDFDNFEPWPSVDVPFNAVPGTVGGVTTSIKLIGTAVLVVQSSAGAFTSSFPATITRWLPGTLIQLNSANVYTLWSRPVSVNLAAPPAAFYTAYLFRLLENCGFGTAAGSVLAAPSQMSVQEPLVGNQKLPYMWGPSGDGGTIFACGDPLRPGNAYFSKNFAPDSAPDKYNVEITPPSEPLLGGEVMDGVAFVASSARWWRLIPSFSSPNHYTPEEIPEKGGLASPWGHCTDGKDIYYWAKDGIRSFTKGSLTDADLYNLFPHDGVAGESVVRNGITVHAPDYGRAATFRLCTHGGYLYADYQDASGAGHTLVCRLANVAWSMDDLGGADTIQVHYAVEQPLGAMTSGADVSFPILLVGTAGGRVEKQSDTTNDLGIATGYLATAEWNGGDERASKLWGDVVLDIIPAGLDTFTVVNQVSQQVAIAPPTTIAKSTSRQLVTLSDSGGVLSRFLGLFITWIDYAEAQTVKTTFYLWQPSVIEKPETTTDRAQDLDDAGMVGAKFIQGFILEADTFNAPKQLGVRSGDDLQLKQTFAITHNGQQEKAYSFATPFIAHLLRLEPQDAVQWRLFGVKWVFEPTPESVLNWITQGTSFGNDGYSHIRSVMAAYASTAPVTLTITAQDGTSPAVLTLPSTGGAYKKTLFMLSPNKGMLYTFSAVSANPWQPFLRDWVIEVGAWGRTSGYVPYKSLGGEHGVGARI